MSGHARPLTCCDSERRCEMEDAERKRLIAWYNARRLMCKCRCATGH